MNAGVLPAGLSFARFPFVVMMSTCPRESEMT